MFTSKGLFSDITCPYSENCVLPKCLFAHPKKAVPKTASPVAGVSSVAEETPKDQQEKTEVLEDRQRKRRKLDDGETITVRTAKKEEGTKLAQKTEVITEAKSVQKTSTPLSSESRPISPPPTQRTSALSPATTQKLTSGTVKPITVPKVALKTPAPPEKPLKAESLNPRLLKHSPATHDLRFRLVKALHDQLVRLNTELLKDASSLEKPLILSAQHLITMALDIEEKAALEKPAIHSSVVKNTILRYKKMSGADWKKERQVEHDSVIAKTQASNGIKVTVAPLPVKPIETSLSPHVELAILRKLHTSLMNLSAHGYITAIPSDESITKAKAGVSAAQGWEVCDRCKARFQVFPGRRESDGLLTSGGSCTYHWGKPFFPARSSTDVKGSKREKRYRCCGQVIGDSPGCTKADSHVFKVSEVKRLAALFNFIETPENEDADEDKPICIDGEMGYTVYGLELIRLTATSWPSGDPVLDVLVRPFGEVLDLNSRWSGVLASQLTDAPPLAPDSKTKKYDPTQLAGTEKLYVVESPAVARELLLRFLTPKTAIIGHGLENDLNSVRLIHHTVIDTALLFPHQAGLPYRNALRTLVSLHLGRTIQSGGGMTAQTLVAVGEADIVTGHDSKEDANAAGDLVLWAIGREWEKMKGVGWTVADETLVPPSRISESFLEGTQVKIEETIIKSGVKRKREVDDGQVGK